MSSNSDLLAELLAELFDVKELRKFVRQYRLGKVIYARLPEDEEDVEELAYTVVSEWARKGLINAELQERLKSACAEYRTSIDEVFDEILEGEFEEGFDEEEEDDDSDEDFNDLEFEEDEENFEEDDDFEEDDEDFDEDEDFEEDDDFEGDEDFEDEDFEEEEEDY